MFVKSFVLRLASFDAIVSQCVSGTIAVVRPEKALENLFRAVIRKRIVEKEDAAEELGEVKAYLDAVSDHPAYRQKKEEFLEYVQDYLHKAVGYAVPVASVEDYILAQSALLCAQAVADAAGVEVLDGRELVVCRQDGPGTVFDWAATCAEIERKCQGKSHLVIAGGYARTPRGAVIGVGKGGANMMSALVASALQAESIEFYVEGEGINGIAAMTYDEAAHYCASKSAPFPSAALWPAKKAGIPIVVKSIAHPDFAGTRIASQQETASAKAVSGLVVDSDLDLVTVYGTGLMGHVGASSAIFSALAKAGVNIRFISQTSSEYAITFAVGSADSGRVSAAIGELMADNPLIPVDDLMVVNREVAILTLYGSQMRSVPGVSGKVFSLLGAAGVNVIASAQGGEELSISVVLDVADLAKAQRVLGVLYEG
ncbi:MAG: ACT domain-containing protein [Bacteroidales bacterium]|nr:ACT domain-containing protein [Bacteroidales bacterium]